MEEKNKKQKIANKKEPQNQGYQPSRFIQMRQQALLQQSSITMKIQIIQGEQPVFSGQSHISQRSQSADIEKKKFKPNISPKNQQVNTSVQLTSFEKKQLFPVPAPKQIQKQQFTQQKKAPLPQFRQATSNVQITLGGYTKSQNLPQIVTTKPDQVEKKFELDEKKYLKPIQIVVEQNVDTQTQEEKNLKELLPPLALQQSVLKTEEKIDLDQNLTLIQFPQKLPIKEQLDYYQNGLEKSKNQKLPDFTQFQENKQLLLKFLVKNTEQNSSSFTKLIPNNLCKKYFTGQQKGVFRLGKVLEYESGKVEMIIGGVRFSAIKGAKQDFVQEACVIQKPCNSEESTYQLIQLGEVQNKLIVVPKFD